MRSAIPVRKTVEQLDAFTLGRQIFGALLAADD
jgi:hypothetical protein